MRMIKLFSIIVFAVFILSVVAADAGEIMLQPGPEDGVDVWVTSVSTGGGKDNWGLIVGGWGDWYYTLIKFNLDSLPSDINSARIELYTRNNVDP